MYFTEVPTCMHAALAALILPNNRSGVRSTFKTLTITNQDSCFVWLGQGDPSQFPPTNNSKVRYTASGAGLTI